MENIVKQTAVALAILAVCILQRSRKIIVMALPVCWRRRAVICGWLCNWWPVFSPKESADTFIIMASTWAHARAGCKCRSGQHFALFPDHWQQTHFTWISIYLFLKRSVFLYFHDVLWARLYKDGASSVGEFVASRHLVTCAFGFSVKMCAAYLWAFVKFEGGSRVHLVDWSE